jgi:CheY-like chemotaxis protein
MSAPTEPSPPSRAVILVVDDQEIIRDVARRILESRGYSVVTAAGGPEAVDIIQARPNEITAALIDMVMPRLSGAETVAALRAVQPSLRIVLMSGDNLQEQAARHNLQGIAGYVQKPFRMQSLLAGVEAALP